MSVPFTTKSYIAQLFLFFPWLFVYPGINSIIAFSFALFSKYVFLSYLCKLLSTHSKPLSFPSVWTSRRKCSWIALTYWNLDWLSLDLLHSWYPGISLSLAPALDLSFLYFTYSFCRIHSLQPHPHFWHCCCYCLKVNSLWYLSE